MNRGYENASSGQCQYEEEGGVDLNRNYDWQFNMTQTDSNNTSSSDDPCAEIFKGPRPFSEPET